MYSVQFEYFVTCQISAGPLTSFDRVFICFAHFPTKSFLLSQFKKGIPKRESSRWEPGKIMASTDSGVNVLRGAMSPREIRDAFRVALILGGVHIQTAELVANGMTLKVPFSTLQRKF